jgi:hypothetical protein
MKTSARRPHDQSSSSDVEKIKDLGCRAFVDAEARRSIGVLLPAVTGLVAQGLGTSAIADRL